MFEGMSDDEEDFQSVSLLRRRVRPVVQQVTPEVTFCLFLGLGESSRGPQQNDGLRGDAPGVPGSQRGHGPAAYHAERAGHGTGPGQHA